jgi:hypothetical protein
MSEAVVCGVDNRYDDGDERSITASTSKEEGRSKRKKKKKKKWGDRRAKSEMRVLAGQPKKATATWQPSQNRPRRSMRYGTV